MSWTIKESADYAKAKRGFAKACRPEVNAVIANIATIIRALDAGSKVEQIKKENGFVHGEYPLDIISIDQTGHGKKSKPKALRAYVWASMSEKVLYVMILGDKSEQENDVRTCVATVREIKKELEK